MQRDSSVDARECCLRPCKDGWIRIFVGRHVQTILFSLLTPYGFISFKPLITRIKPHRYAAHIVAAGCVGAGAVESQNEPADRIGQAFLKEDEEMRSNFEIENY